MSMRSSLFAISISPTTRVMRSCGSQDSNPGIPGSEAVTLPQRTKSTNNRSKLPFSFFLCCLDCKKYIVQINPTILYLGCFVLKSILNSFSLLEICFDFYFRTEAAITGSAAVNNPRGFIFFPPKLYISQLSATLFSSIRF